MAQGHTEERTCKQQMESKVNKHKNTKQREYKEEAAEQEESGGTCNQQDVSMMMKR